MIDGVTILNQFEVVTEEVFSWPACWAGVIVGLIAGLIGAIVFGACEQEWSAFLFALPFFCLLFAIFFGWFAGDMLCPEAVAWETQYEVAVSSEVNFEEFMSLYEIVETRGNIYTIRIR